jgi:hypothetical protein
MGAMKKNKLGELLVHLTNWGVCFANYKHSSPVWFDLLFLSFDLHSHSLKSWWCFLHCEISISVILHFFGSAVSISRQWCFLFTNLIHNLYVMWTHFLFFEGEHCQSVPAM